MSAALESIRRQLKPAYMWELTAENCHQIYSRLLKIDPFFRGVNKATGDIATTNTSSVASPNCLTVIELHPHQPSEENDCGSTATESGEGGGIAFFGSIPQILSNINSLIAELQPTTADEDDDGAPNNHGRNQDEAEERRKEKKNKEEVFEDVDRSSGGGGNSFFIDVSCSATVPRIMQDEETVALKRLLLRLRDYLRAKTAGGAVSCLNANDCLRRTEVPASASGTCGELDSCPWDLCFLSGVLLGYPVLLCNSTPEEGNCLAHQPLLNYTVTLEDHHFPLYSFSVPERFQANFSGRISRWFEKLQQREERLRLRQTVETHPLILT